MRSFGSDQSGAALVEVAISALFLITVMVGITEFGRALFTYDLVQNAARIGSRYAQVRGSGCVTYASPSPGVACTAYGATAPPSPAPYVTPIQTYVQSKSPGINPAQLTVTTTWSAACNFSVGASPAPTTSPLGVGACVKVQVSYPFKSLFPYTFPATMTAASQVVLTQ